MADSIGKLLIKDLGSRTYEECLSDMQSFVQKAAETKADTQSEIWFVEHLYPPLLRQIFPQ